MSKDDRELIERLRGLLATATPELTNGTVSQKTLADLLRLGAEHQRPQADNWNSIDWRSDAALIVAAIESLPALLTRLEALQAQPVGEAIEHALGFVTQGMVIAYENGLRECGYDPVATLRAALTASPPVVEREAIALALLNESRRFSGLPLLAGLNGLQPHQYRDQLRYADAILGRGE